MKKGNNRRSKYKSNNSSISRKEKAALEKDRTKKEYKFDHSNDSSEKLKDDPHKITNSDRRKQIAKAEVWTT